MKRFDLITNKLKLDTNRWVYIGRTRLNDQTGNQIKCTYHGPDNSSTNPRRMTGMLPHLKLEFPYYAHMVTAEETYDK